MTPEPCGAVGRGSRRAESLSGAALPRLSRSFALPTTIADPDPVCLDLRCFSSPAASIPRPQAPLRDEGFDLLPRFVRLRPAASVRARRGRPGSRGARCPAARDAGHRSGAVRRKRADRRHCGAEGPLGRGDGSAAFRSPTCRPATRSSCRWRWRSPRRVPAADIFLGVNALDYSGYPDCRPEYIAAFERLANLATKAGVEGTLRFQHSCPADPADQGPDHSPRP